MQVKKGKSNFPLRTSISRYTKGTPGGNVPAEKKEENGKVKDVRERERGGHRCFGNFRANTSFACGPFHFFVTVSLFLFHTFPPTAISLGREMPKKKKNTKRRKQANTNFPTFIIFSRANIFFGMQFRILTFSYSRYLANSSLHTYPFLPAEKRSKEKWVKGDIFSLSLTHIWESSSGRNRIKQKERRAFSDAGGGQKEKKDYWNTSLLLLSISSYSQGWELMSHTESHKGTSRQGRDSTVVVVLALPDKTESMPTLLFPEVLAWIIMLSFLGASKGRRKS